MIATWLTSTYLKDYHRREKSSVPALPKSTWKTRAITVELVTVIECGTVSVWAGVLTAIMILSVIFSSTSVGAYIFIGAILLENFFAVPLLIEASLSIGMIVKGSPELEKLGS